MTTLRAIKKLILGETWILPLGVALTVAAGGLLRAAVVTDWSSLGGFLLLGAVLVTLVASVNRSASGR
jgi:hypothetical protein